MARSAPTSPGPLPTARAEPVLPVSTSVTFTVKWTAETFGTVFCAEDALLPSVKREQHLSPKSSSHANHQPTSRSLQPSMSPGSSHSNHGSSSRHASQLLSSQSSQLLRRIHVLVSPYTMATFLPSVDMCPCCPHFQHRGLSFPFPFIAVGADFPLPLLPFPFSGSKGAVFRFLCLSFQRGILFLFLCLSSVFLYLYLLSSGGPSCLVHLCATAHQRPWVQVLQCPQS